MSSAEFRQVMGRFATGVTVVAARDPESGQPRGMTANAFCSVSLDPPLVLVCIDNECNTGDVIQRAGHFSVNVLGENGEKVSRLFAGPAKRKKFGDVSFFESMTGAPILDSALAWIDCTVWATYPGGDHTIFVGQVRDLSVACAADGPLIFYGGSYGTLGPAHAKDAVAALAKQGTHQVA